MKDERINIRISSELKEQLKAYANRENLTMSELITLACLNYISQ